jgi:hypothetical protein
MSLLSLRDLVFSLLTVGRNGEEGVSVAHFEPQLAIEEVAGCGRRFVLWEKQRVRTNLSYSAGA